MNGAEPIRYFFAQDREGLRYEGNGWSLRAVRDRGWVSLKVGDAEFLDSMAIEHSGRRFTYFPDLSNIAHDENVGRIGVVADGLHMIKFTPHRTLPEVELYVGANVPGEQRLLMFLADGVRFENGAVRHPSGATVPIREPVRAETVDGRLAVVFPMKGFAPNAYHLELPATEPLPAVRRVRFDVRSSDDAGHTGLGATWGVVNPIYGPETKLDFGITWEEAPPDFRGYAELEVVHSLGPPHFYQRVAVTGGVTRVQFQPKFHLPGVSEVWGRLVTEDHRLLWVNRYRMAWDWPNYRPKIQVEPDFDEFWDATLQELRAIPLEPATRRVDIEHADFELYDVTFNSWRGQRIHAMMYVPREGKRPLPVILGAHPAATGFAPRKRPDGTYGSEVKHDKRFITIGPLIRGHAPDAPDIPFNHPWWGPLEDRDTYVARAWYCAMVRTLDYLATRPDLADMKRIVAMGGSQGGALALVTAGLDSRVAVCLADCPANCQPHEIMNHYASFGPSKGVIPPGKTVAEVERMLSYYNPVNFCPRIKCPTYIGANIGDLTVHSLGPLAAYHNLTGLKADQKGFYPGFTHFHGSGPGLGKKTKEWLDRLASEPAKGR